jgi:hypothetical protein
MKIPGAAIGHQIIREQCQNHGAAGAFEEAVRRIREVYDECIRKGVSPDTELHLALICQCDRHREAKQ